MANKQNRQVALEANPLHQQSIQAQATAEAQAAADQQAVKDAETAEALAKSDSTMGVSQLEDAPAGVGIATPSAPEAEVTDGLGALAQGLAGDTGAVTTAVGVTAVAADLAAPQVLPAGTASTAAIDPLALPTVGTAAPSKTTPGTNTVVAGGPVAIERRVRAETPEVTAKVAQPSSIDLEFTAAIEKEKQEGTPAMKGLIRSLETYVSTMAPGRTISDNDLIRMQEGMLNQLTFVIERAPSLEFNKLWNMVIAFFRQYSTKALSPKYFNRGGSAWRSDQELFRRLSNLLNLLYHSAADLKTAKNEVSLETTLRVGFSAEARGRITAFYDNV